MTQEKLAETILLAVKFRENSFDHASANNSRGLLTTDFNHYYINSLETSCKMAAKQIYPEGRTLTYMLLKNCWNESVVWASKIIKNQQNTQKD